MQGDQELHVSAGESKSAGLAESPGPTSPPAVGCATIAFGVVAYLFDDGDLKTALAWGEASDGQAEVMTASWSS